MPPWRTHQPGLDINWLVYIFKYRNGTSKQIILLSIEYEAREMSGHSTITVSAEVHASADRKRSLAGDLGVLQAVNSMPRAIQEGCAHPIFIFFRSRTSDDVAILVGKSRHKA